MTIFAFICNEERLDGAGCVPVVINLRVDEIAFIRVDPVREYETTSYGTIVMRSGFKFEPTLLTAQWDALLAAFNVATGREPCPTSIK